MDNFWCDINYVEVDAIWLLKFKAHLDTLEKIQLKSNRRSLEKYPRIPYLKKWFLKDLMNPFRFSNLNMILMHFVILNFQALIIFTPFLTSVRVALFLELLVPCKLARMGLQFVILSSLRGTE